MKVTVKQWHPVAQWRWDMGDDHTPDEEGDVCGICRVPYEGCCPACKMPGDDCPLMWGQCTHVFHMHCVLKWTNTAASKGLCPMDRRPWSAVPCLLSSSVAFAEHRSFLVTADRKVAR
ncbi:anaphase-promoting complex subunit 11 RING-H2 finger-domain-containing protein [Pterulicium gracile]|uniref:Anaphase-promoting complex subunit 11 n=1 Tax=Pterulicium gracile TaxID=1884261 RepID=A0A5C3Q5K1_9AGAR|nr:anaphase-promoting complex subunit 11 RING-H2 finger-domain-containing protein [Pterula gracilis]